MFTEDRIPEAEAYVQTRFYPPLPYQYGALAVEALNAYAEDPDAIITLPEGLNPVPRRTVTNYENGVQSVSAGELIDVLRLWHMLDDEE